MAHSCYLPFRLTPLQTCHSFTDCGSCLENEIKFKCNWCPALNRCSSGVDRKRQEWTNAGELTSRLVRFGLNLVDPVSKEGISIWNIFRVRQDANIRRCQAMRCNDPQHIINSPRGLDTRKREVFPQCIASHSAGASKIECGLRHHRLLDLRNNLRGSLLGVLRLHAPAHEQRSIPDSIRPASSVVVATRRSKIHRSVNTHVKRVLPQKNHHSPISWMDGWSPISYFSLLFCT